MRDDGGGGGTPLHVASNLTVDIKSLSQFGESLAVDAKAFNQDLTDWNNPGSWTNPHNAELGMVDAEDWPGHGLRKINEDAATEMAKLSMAIWQGLDSLAKAASNMADLYPSEDGFSAVSIDQVDVVFTMPKADAQGGDPSAPRSAKDNWNPIFAADGTFLGFDKNKNNVLEEDEKFTAPAPPEKPDEADSPHYRPTTDPTKLPEYHKPEDVHPDTQAASDDYNDSKPKTVAPGLPYGGPQQPSGPTTLA